MKGGLDTADSRRDLEALLALSKHPQVSVKVSAYYALGAKKPPYDDLGPLVRRLRDAYGSKRLMWATDCPFQILDHTYQQSIDLIRHGLDFLTATDKEWILRKTAERVFFA